MPTFAVLVQRGCYALDPSPSDYDVKSQNAAHAAASALSLAGGGQADTIEVRALEPRPGKPVKVVFKRCSQGLYGFCYTSRSAVF